MFLHRPRGIATLSGSSLFAKVPVYAIPANSLLSFVFGETTKRVLLQTVKTQMKSSMMLHFIRVYTVCKGKKDLRTTDFFFNYNLTPLDTYNGLFQVYCIIPAQYTNGKLQTQQMHVDQSWEST